MTDRDPLHPDPPRESPSHAEGSPPSRHPSSSEESPRPPPPPQRDPGLPHGGGRPPGDTGAERPRRFRAGLLYLLLLLVFIFTIKRFFEPQGVEASYNEFLHHLRSGHVLKLRLADDYHVGIMSVPKAEGSTSEGNGQAASPGTGSPAPGTAPSASEPGEASASQEDPTRDAEELLLGLKIGGKLPPWGEFRFYVTAARDDKLIEELDAANAKFGTVFTQKPPDSLLTSLSILFLPLLIMGVIFFIFLRQSGQVGRAAISFGKTRAKLYVEKVKTVTFDDVAGCEEAKAELEEVVDFLKNPKKYQTLGGRMPKGILLVGPPGTGKTLLARAVAGESQTPFLSLSGSDFVEMFVGVGAARVRDLFQQAKHRAPCIVFVDELDAVGRHRGAGLGGGHDEREQTLNQLLVEMDGFDTTQGVIFLAATNRPDVLDPALLRPGRFDRQVVIDAPDAKGRRAILEVHARDKQVAADIDFGVLAANTAGFTGADLANVINEAALLAARAGKSQIGKTELDEAVERAIAGPERRSRRLGEEERKRVAYHEAGHALVAALSKHADPVRKISIIPRGHAALGYTIQSPTDDRYLITRHALVDRLKGLLAGRAAEEIVFGELSTGAANDLSRATDIARGMVCRFGMSLVLGPAAFGREHQQVFLGRDFSQEERNYSDSTALEIDREVRAILESANDEAKQILADHRACLEHLAETLLEREVIQGSELDAMLQRELCARSEPAPAAQAPAAQGSTKTS